MLYNTGVFCLLPGVQVCAKVVLPDLPPAGLVPGAHPIAPGAAHLPLPPVQQGVPLAV